MLGEVWIEGVIRLSVTIQDRHFIFADSCVWETVLFQPWLKMFNFNPSLQQLAQIKQ